MGAGEAQGEKEDPGAPIYREHQFQKIGGRYRKSLEAGEKV